MHLKLKLLQAGFLSILLLTSCVTSIKKINHNAARLNGKKVFIKGRVISSLELSGMNCFTLRDRSAKILVVTDNLLPLKNDKIKVRGIVEQKYPYKNQTLLVVKEKKMKLTKIPDSKKNRNKSLF